MTPVRIAVIADVHGNLPALEAVLDDLAARGGADRVVDLGDRVSGPLWPSETLARLTAFDCVAVRGNHDRVVGLATAPLGASDAYAAGALTAAERRALATLPTTIEVAAGILACHGTPLSDVTYLLEDVHDGRLVDASPASVGKRLPATPGTQIVLCAHSHRPGMRRLGDGRTIINPGSVGCPAYDDPDPPAHVSETGSPSARYAVVEIAHSRTAPRIEFIAVPYEHERAARRADANDRPEWAYALRTGAMPVR